MADRQISERELIQLFEQEKHNLHAKEALVERIVELLRDTTTAKEVLNEVQKNKSGKMQINIGSGVMIEVEAKEVTKCKRPFAEKGYIEQPIEETKKWLEEREENFKKEFEKAQGEYSAVHNRVEEIASVLKRIEAEKRKAPKQQPFIISK